MTDAIELPGQQGAAEKFVARYGNLFRYSAAWKKYIAWDGKRWSTDSGTVFVRGLWQQHLRDTLQWIAANVSAKEMPDALEAVSAMANVNWENAMLTLCQARAPIDYRVLDADPNLLNCNNGIVDLASGELYDHDPTAHCTRLAPVNWEPSAECPKWLDFLTWAMQGDSDRVAYLQRFFGLCLTGDAEHELAHFFWGDGGNGKTTAIKTLEKILGDYARRAPARVLMQRKHESHPTELAGMCGRRLVVFAETNENQTLDEQMLKLVASKDVISARRMHEDFWDYAPTHKAVLLTNNRPRIRGQDEGVWRRIVLLEWGASVTEANKDPHYADRFDAELPGILRWAWEGLRAARADGLRPPAAVREATADYRGAEDSVPQWIETACVLDPKAKAGAGELYAAYSAWAEMHFETRLTQTAFGKRLDAVGCAAAKGTGGARVRTGIRLRNRASIT
ncbi:MAG: phage/plasmid primase, P4 family [Myxococcales bacterium]